MVYVGIDPGKAGAVAIQYMSGEVQVYTLESGKLISLMQSVAAFPNRCCLEEVHAMPKQGVKSMFSFGEGFGYIKGVLETCGISYQTVKPQRWKKEFGLLNADKKASIAVCRRLFPDLSLRPTERSRVDNDGMAEAVLMSEYARRKL